MVFAPSTAYLTYELGIMTISFANSATKRDMQPTYKAARSKYGRVFKCLVCYAQSPDEGYISGQLCHSPIIKTKSVVGSSTVFRENQTDIAKKAKGHWAWEFRRKHPKKAV